MVSLTFQSMIPGKEWLAFLNEFPRGRRDIHFHPAYGAIYSQGSAGAAGSRRAMAIGFVGKNGMRLLYPFLRIDNSHLTPGRAGCDLESFYGYGGPLVERSNPADLTDFHALFTEWCRTENVVAEFVRFHPLLRNEQFLGKTMTVEPNRPTVHLNLQAGPVGERHPWRAGWEEVFRSCRPPRQRNFRKAERMGLTVAFSHDFQTFRDLYQQTMTRVGAAEQYFFDGAFFRRLEHLPATHLKLIEIHHDSRILAAGIFLHDEANLHYFLGANRPEGFPLGANAFMILSMARWGCENGLHILNLGGGRTERPDDSLLRFKSGFSPERSMYYIGKRIHDRQTYEILRGEWETRARRKARLFLQYHEPTETNL